MYDSKEDLSIKEVFDVEGNYQLLVKDKSINKEKFERKVGPTTLVIKGKEVSQIRVKKILPYIKNKYMNRPSEPVTNSNIGTFDIETYRHTRDGNSYVYALGYKIYNGEEKNSI